MEFVIWICGVIFGSIVTSILYLRMRIGTLHIVESHLETEPQLLCELNRPVKALMKKRLIWMAVDHASTRD